MLPMPGKDADFGLGELGLLQRTANPALATGDHSWPVIGQVVVVRAVDDLSAAVRAATDGLGVDAAVDYVGRGTTFQAAIDSLAVAGRAVAIGGLPEAFSFDTRRLVQTEKVITGSRHSTRAEFMETMEIMARGIVKPVIGMRRHFTGLEDIFRAITDQTLSGRGALTYDN